MTRPALPFAAAVVTASVLAGCVTPQEADNSNPSVAATTTKQIGAPAAPASSQVNSGTRSPVQFDPCTEFDDPTIQRAGYDPETRQRTDGIHEWYAFIGCRFGDKEPIGTLGTQMTIRSINASATNITLNEFRKKYEGKYSEQMIGGRSAVKYSATRSCGMAIEFPNFVLDLTNSADFTSEKNCDNILKAATVLEAAATESIKGR